MITFAELGLPSPLLQAITRLAYTTPTPIQEQAIPLAMQGHDIIGRAATGSGKTAAFLLPMMTELLKERERVGLILVPTREIAIQTVEVFRKLAIEARGMECAIIIGGAPMGPQIRSLQRGPRVVVATPGRLNDHLDRGTISLQNVAFLVLDEADRMLDMGFAPQLDRIARHLSGDRQTMLFSATIPDDILRLSKKYLKDPKSVSIGPANAPVPKIAQKIVHVEAARKADRLVTELNERAGSVIVFARTQIRADRLCRTLRDNNFAVAVLHGGMPQGKRQRNLQGFRSGEARILVATDIAARGLDIPHVAHVVNFDLPMQAEDYVHRIGRTARAGAEGAALCLVSADERPLLREIARHTVGAEVEGAPISSSKPVAPRNFAHPHRGQGQGRPFPPKRHAGGGPKKGGHSPRFGGGPARPSMGKPKTPKAFYS